MESSRIEGLDGLRAFAVLVVLAFHLWPSLMPGGFIGVDVFFVISGYLITTLLLREQKKNGRVDLLAFWKRRARRLLPALIVVVSTSIAAAWLVSAELLVNIRRQTVGALTFSTNWVEIFAGTDYFAGADQALFITFWSLAVEEQFYLLWPLLLIAVTAIFKWRSIRVLIAISAAAGSAWLMASLYNPSISPTRIYYGTDTHCFGLMIGIAVAFAMPERGRFLNSGFWNFLRPLIGFASIAGLSALVVRIEHTAEFTFRGGLLLASVLSAAAVSVLPGKDTFFTSFCRLKPLAWVGERSYGLYLWHWPAIMIMDEARSLFFPELPLWASISAVIILTLALTEASYRWIEMPIREAGFRATWENISEALSSGRAWIRIPGFVTVLVVAVFVSATFGLIRAPLKSKVQMSVEAGEQEMAEQNSFVETEIPTALPSHAADPNAAWPPEFEIPPGEYIAMFGDSVVSGSAKAIYEKFPGIYINAKPSMQWRDALGMMKPLLDKGTMRPVVILNYGTNAGFKEQHSVDEFKEVLAALGPSRRIVIVNTVGYSHWVRSTNELLNRISAEYPNTVVADWWTIANTKPGLLYRDKTHPNPAGTVAYLEVVEDALKRLGPK